VIMKRARRVAGLTAVRPHPASSTDVRSAACQRRGPAARHRPQRLDRLSLRAVSDPLSPPPSTPHPIGQLDGQPGLADPPGPVTIRSRPASVADPSGSQDR